MLIHITTEQIEEEVEVKGRGLFQEAAQDVCFLFLFIAMTFNPSCSSLVGIVIRIGWNENVSPLFILRMRIEDADRDRYVDLFYIFPPSLLIANKLEATTLLPRVRMTD